MFKSLRRLKLGKRNSTSEHQIGGVLAEESIAPAPAPAPAQSQAQSQAQSPAPTPAPTPNAASELGPTFGTGLPEIRIEVEDTATSSKTDIAIPCEICGPLTACTEEPVATEALFNSADNGCSICLLFWDVRLLSQNANSIDYISSWSGSNGVFGVYLIEKTVEDGIEEPGQTIAIVVLAADGERSPSPFPWLPNVYKSPFNRSQLRDTQVLSAWVNDCQANHPSCRQEMLPKLPTRIINVGSGTTQPFLKITNGEVGRYLALSHRWGTPDSQVKMLVTKRGFIEDFCRAIPFESFPLTFRHAIEVARSLGIQYLWIDSLCIIQDDVQDWEIEAARMGDIYENAYATLFAERAAHCEAGLFQTEEDKISTANWVKEIEHWDTQTDDQTWILASTRHTYYPNSLAPEEAFCLVDKSISNLQKRGWIMQEEILSRRKICFSSTELHWQCTLLSRCECGLQSLAESRATDNDLTRNLLVTKRVDGSITRGLTVSNSTRRLAGRTTNLNRSWKKLVEMYGLRSFTHERDRLSALAGVASKLNRQPQDYWAGVWREDASDQLLWRGWNRPGAPCSRHDAYRAPSWSWASIRGGVSFCSFGMDSHQETAIPIWKIVEGFCQPSGENPMGPVSKGWLRIRSQAVPVFVDEREGPGPKLETGANNMMSYDERGIHQLKRDGKTYHLLLRRSQNQETSDTSVSDLSIISLDSEDDWDTFAGKTNQRFLYIVAYVGSASGAAISDSTFRSMGLLIRESSTFQGCWERVCYVAPKGLWGSWRAMAEEKEIILR